MGRSSSTILLSAAAILLIAATTTTALNITKLLEDKPDYSEFNSLLTKTKLADEINSRNTITVLVLKNDKIGDIKSKPEDVQKRILSAHVLLDYFDNTRLQQIKEPKLTNLFQASGNAKDQQGSLNVVRKDGAFFFGSSVNGAPQDAKLEEAVVSQPYNISVLRISQAIVIPGIDAPLTPNAGNASAQAPASSSAAKAPASSAVPPTAGNAPAASAVPPTAAAETPKAAAAPGAEVPATSAASSPDGTASSAPAAAAGPAAAPKAEEAADHAHASPPKKSSAVVNGVSFGLIVGLLSLLAA